MLVYNFKLNIGVLESCFVHLTPHIVTGVLSRCVREGSYSSRRILTIPVDMGQPRIIVS